MFNKRNVSKNVLFENFTVSFEIFISVTQRFGESDFLIRIIVQCGSVSWHASLPAAYHMVLVLIERNDKLTRLVKRFN